MQKVTGALAHCRCVTPNQLFQSDWLNAYLLAADRLDVVSYRSHASERIAAILTFKCGKEDFVNQLGLVITLRLLVRLLLESQTLVKGVVQLCVCVADLLLADECLETLAETGNIAVVLGEGAHNLWVANAVAV